MFEDFRAVDWDSALGEGWPVPEMGVVEAFFGDDYDAGAAVEVYHAGCEGVLVEGGYAGGGWGSVG